MEDTASRWESPRKWFAYLVGVVFFHRRRRRRRRRRWQRRTGRRRRRRKRRERQKGKRPSRNVTLPNRSTGMVLRTKAPADSSSLSLSLSSPPFSAPLLRFIFLSSSPPLPSGKKKRKRATTTATAFRRAALKAIRQRRANVCVIIAFRTRRSVEPTPNAHRHPEAALEAKGTRFETIGRATFRPRLFPATHTQCRSQRYRYVTVCRGADYRRPSATASSSVSADRESQSRPEDDVVA